MTDNKTPLCYGVLCEKHHKCARYLDVDGAKTNDFIGTCEKDGARPMFVLAQKYEFGFQFRSN